MKLIITDTNVFFDLISIGALHGFFSLDYEICTTDFVVREIIQSHQRIQIESFISSGRLSVFNLSSDEIEEVKAFATIRSFSGITDKTVLWKSIQLGCILLTGDGKLRKEATDHRIEVHGSIWVITELLASGKIDHETAIRLLNNLKMINNSLPREEIDRLIKILK